jgi:hypothetical protein
MESMKNVGRYRLAITDYFDSVTSEIDFSIEQELQTHFDDEVEQSEINAKRSAYLEEIKDAEAFNLKHLDKEIVKDLASFNQLDEQSQNSRLFRKFCFALEYKGSLRLVVTDIYLSEMQLKMFKSLIFYNYPTNSYLNYSIDFDFYAQIFDLTVNKVSEFG